MKENNPKQNTAPRPPVVVVMGHIDHGKSTLLDYIRKTNVAETEAGGITQSLSAYEVALPTPDKSGSGPQSQASGKITFLDTPGHEAFSKMRARGANVADIAILVVSATEGVQPQTIEAWKTINEAGLPAIVAINKIDRPEANVEKTKMALAEREIFLENYGGKIPYAEISAKTGAGVDHLLTLILILAEVENLNGNPNVDASGFVLESHLDSKRGIEATLLIKNGTMQKGMTVAAGRSFSTVRIMENFKGEPIEKAAMSSPMRVFGFDELPEAGEEFRAFKTKKEAEEYAEKPPPRSSQRRSAPSKIEGDKSSSLFAIPLFIKADVSGALEALEKEIAGIKWEDGEQKAEFKIIGKGVGPVSLSDVKNIGAPGNAIIIGFDVEADKTALELAGKRGITVSFFDVIYKMKEWLIKELEARRPRVETVETTGRAKIIRAFSRTKERQIIGGKVLEGQMLIGGTVKIMRRDFEIGRGKIVNLEKNKEKTGAVEEGSEFGMMLESKIEVAPGDVLELFSVAQK